MTTDCLTPLQTAALAGVIKPKDATAAKAAVPVGMHAVDFAVRVTGHVTRKADTPGTTATAAAVVSLQTPLVFAECLKRLKVETKDLARVLRAIGRKHFGHCSKSLPAQSDYLDCFVTVEKQIAESLPRLDVTVSGRAGACSTDATVSIVGK